MADITKSNPSFGTQRALGIQQALSTGQPITSGYASRVSQAVAPTAGQELQQAFGQYEAAQQKQAKLQQAQTQTATMKEMIGRQKQAFDLGQESQRRLASLDSRAKNEMLDMELQFKRDVAGQKYMSDRQLMDWYTTKARSEEEYKNFAQNLQNGYERKAQLLTAVYDRLATLEKQAFAKSTQERKQALQMDISRMNRADQEILANMQIDLNKELAELSNKSRVELAEAKAAAERKIAEMQQKAANVGAIAENLPKIGANAFIIGQFAAGGSLVEGVTGKDLGIRKSLRNIF